MLRLPVLLILLLWALSACSAPAPTSSLPPATAATPAAVAIDRSCRSDADCTVKNVGNCCGAYPACVNVASPVDPAGVQARCQAQGMMGVCGFTEIQGCRCLQGQCRAAPAQADALRRPLTTNPETEH